MHFLLIFFIIIFIISIVSTIKYIINYINTIEYKINCINTINNNKIDKMKKKNNNKIKNILKIINILVYKLYYVNKYHILNIVDNYIIDFFINMYIKCKNEKNIKITLPLKNKKNIIGSSIYIKNLSNYNILIYSQNICSAINFVFENNTVLIRPHTLIQIMLINESTYLFLKL